ncbi:MAG: hypothetical protein IPM95_14105 [Sphingobacteriales bacterium]|nr:hypothetical protein [Sphingobacteriales bacterium]
MKKMLSCFFACSVLFTACKSNKTDSAETTIEQNMDEIKSSTAEQGQAGKGKITLQCNGKTYEINGVCGAVTSMGSLTIAVPDDSFPAKTFTINFTADKLPDATSTYKITKYNIDDKDARHVTVSYADMRSTSTMIWESDDKTGKLDFVVNGNEIKCTFSNLTLQPSMMYNKGEQDGTATVSGELMIYKV